MKLTINPKELQKQLKKAERVIPQKSIISILDNFLIEVKDDGLLITANDTEVCMQCPATILAKDGDNVDFCVNAKKFVQVLASIKTDSVDIVVNHNTHELTFIHTKGKFTMPCQQADDYPTLVAPTNTTPFYISTNELNRLITDVAFACSNDDLRPALKGVYFDFSNDSLTCVATDTHKLVKSEKALNNTECQPFIMPQRAINALLSITDSYDGSVEIHNDGSVVAMICDNDCRIYFKQINGKYPNYNSVFPKGSDKQAVINATEFMESIQRVLLSASNTLPCVILDFNANTIKISARDLDFSISAEEEFACSYQGEGLRIGFNGLDLQTMISNICSQSEGFVMHLTDKSHAAIITPCDNSHVLSLLMPLMCE